MLLVYWLFKFCNRHMLGDRVADSADGCKGLSTCLTEERTESVKIFRMGKYCNWFWPNCSRFYIHTTHVVIHFLDFNFEVHFFYGFLIKMYPLSPLRNKGLYGALLG
jgi:hypothetical protein